ncbi:MAG: squalene/phytoene synthase family protein [Proteobacteria bacterium]|nr:squalene/phytoene synthase family protein [Pseudomonadota bacterium]
MSIQNILLVDDSKTELHALSDHTCTALQLANFWQDVARDYAMGRIYLPQSTMDEFGSSEAEIAAGRATAQFRDVIRYEVGRARALFRAGMPLIERVAKPARIDIALFTAGGLAVLRAIERQDYDVLSRRPALTGFDKAKLFGMAFIRSKLGLTPLPASAAQ